MVKSSETFVSFGCLFYRRQYCSSSIPSLGFYFGCCVCVLICGLVLFVFGFLGGVDDVVDIVWDEWHPLFSPLEDYLVVESFVAAVVDVAPCAVQYPACFSDYVGLWLLACYVGRY